MLARLIRRLAFGSLDYHAGDKVWAKKWHEERWRRTHEGKVVKVIHTPTVLGDAQIEYQVRLNDGSVDIYEREELGRVIESVDS